MHEGWWWHPPSDDFDHDEDRELMTVFYQYSDPFSAECRAFGRLEESGHTDLAIRCFGYLLLDEKHESAVMRQFGKRIKSFSGAADDSPSDSRDERSRFPGRDGGNPPIRGIVKELGPQNRVLRASDARQILRDTVKLQQLGIIQMDLGMHQLIGGKYVDFSVAVTHPHYITDRELHTNLTPEWRAKLEWVLFCASIGDYWEYDYMVRSWNSECKGSVGQARPGLEISVPAFPGGRVCHVPRYSLRRTPERDRVYTLVDPRRYDWRSRHIMGRKGRTREGASEPSRVRLDARPPRWYLDCNSTLAEDLRKRHTDACGVAWNYKDGLFTPTRLW